MARLQKEAWEIKEDGYETKIGNLAAANRGLAEGLMQASRERDGLQDLITDLKWRTFNLLLKKRDFEPNFYIIRRN